MTTGFFTDTTLCIGCKACEVACKQWNELPSDGFEFTGDSYDNTGALSGTTWRHVGFVEQTSVEEDTVVERWLMQSDVCKHCANAGCMEACPTGAIVRNEFGAVFVQPDICNGCGYCVVSCPFGVVDLIEKFDPNGSHYISPRCATIVAATTRQRCKRPGASPANARSATIANVWICSRHARKRARRNPFSSDRSTNCAIARANASTRYANAVSKRRSTAKATWAAASVRCTHFLLTDAPETYNLPMEPVLPSTRQRDGYTAAAIAVGALALTAFAIFRNA